MKDIFLICTLYLHFYMILIIDRSIFFITTLNSYLIQITSEYALILGTSIDLIRSRDINVFYSICDALLLNASKSKWYSTRNIISISFVFCTTLIHRSFNLVLLLLDFLLTNRRHECAKFYFWQHERKITS